MAVKKAIRTKIKGKPKSTDLYAYEVQSQNKKFISLRRYRYESNIILMKQPGGYVYWDPMMGYYGNMSDLVARYSGSIAEEMGIRDTDIRDIIER